MQNLAIEHDSAVSPELALVDPGLRERALAALPPLEPFDFLRLRDLPPEPVRAPRRAVAAAAYLALAILRACAFNVVVFAAVAGIVLVLDRLG